MCNKVQKLASTHSTHTKLKHMKEKQRAHHHIYIIYHIASSEWAWHSIGRRPPASRHSTPTVSDLFRRPNSQARNTVPECFEQPPSSVSQTLAGGWVAGSAGESQQKHIFYPKGNSAALQWCPVIIIINHDYYYLFFGVIMTTITYFLE